MTMKLTLQKAVKVMTRQAKQNQQSKTGSENR